MNNDLRYPGRVPQTREDRSRGDRERSERGPLGPVRTEGRTDPRSGSIIAGRFQIDKLIARGGMSTVYLAHQTRLQRPVALKVLTPPPTSEEAVAFEHRFRREGQTLAALDHPNIVVLYDYGETEDGRYFLAMEYINGPRLSDVLKDGPLSAERALNLIVQVAAGLRYAHKRGVVHRDLKPSNLLIRRDEDGNEHVKIVDFGLVKLTEVDQNITRAGLILGSPHCMSPEQVKGLDVDHRADVYAIGVLLFRCLTGQYPFHGANSAATMVAHLNHPIPTFYSVSPELEVPPGLEEVVRRCLAKSAHERYGDMREVIGELTALMETPPEGVRTLNSTSSSSLLQHALGSQSGAYAPVMVPVHNAGSQGGMWVALLASAVVVVLLLGVGMGALVVGGLMQLERTTAPATPIRTESALAEQPAPQPVVAAPPREIPARAGRAPRAAAPRATAADPRATRATAPAKKPTSTEADGDVKAPEGYLGLPDDLLE